MSSEIPPLGSPEYEEYIQDIRAKKALYIHAEAFMVLYYGCNSCQKIEAIWNSRDGVTPFTIGCPHCGGRMIDITPKDNPAQPDYVPGPDMRVFYGPSEVPYIHTWRNVTRSGWVKARPKIKTKWKQVAKKKKKGARK